MRARRAVAGPIAAAALLVAGLPPSAANAADTLDAAIPDLVGDTTASIRLSGTSESDEALLYAYVTPSSDACEWGPGLPHMAAALVRGDRLRPGAFSIEAKIWSRSLHEQRLCAWLDRFDEAPEARIDRVFAARAPRGSVSVTASFARRDHGDTYTVTATGTAETRLELAVSAKPGAGGTCEPSMGRDWQWVGPGPFSVTREVYLGLPDHTVCAELSAYAGLGMSIALGAPFSVTSPRQPTEDELVPVVAAEAPEDGASGVRLRPEFRWARGPSSSRDVLVVESVRNGVPHPDLKLNANRYRWFRDGRWSKPAPTSDLVTFRRDGASYVVALRGSEWVPGRYRWSVERPHHKPSPWRTFEVIAPRLQRLTATFRRTEWDTSVEPGYTRIRLVGAAWSDFFLRYRIGGGAWRRARVQRSGASAFSVADVLWTCRRAGAAIHWQASVRDWYGTVREASGRIPGASRAACARMRRREAAELRRYRRMIARFRRSCRSVGGAPRIVRVDGRKSWGCVGPDGRLIRPPGF